MKPSAIITYLLFVLLLLVSTGNAWAQKKPGSKDDSLPDVDEFIENLTEDLEDAEIDFDTYQEKLYDYIQKPIKLNIAEYEDLADLGLLTDVQIQGILAYRQTVGRFISIYELQAVPQLDLETCRRIAPFFSAGDLDDFNIPFKQLLSGGQNQVYFRWSRTLNAQAGYLAKEQPDGTFRPTYRGSPDRLYLRYRYNYGNKISYGFTAEKDPGEEFFSGSQKRGFDFYSAHFYLRNVGKFKHIAIGDYEVKLGQGLTVWTGLGFRKGSFVMNVARNAQPIRAYTSVNEALFFRGAATTFGGKKWEATVFASYKPISGNVVNPAPPLPTDSLLVDEETDIPLPDADDAADISEVSSLLLSGLHRTDAEIADRQAINQLVTGGSLGYKTRRLVLNANAVYTRLSTNLNPRQAAYNQFRFSGSELLNVSLDYRYLWRNFHFFGETAMSQNGGLATLNGLLLALDAKVSMSVLHRYYQRNYQTLFAAPFAESTLPNNEQGTFIGLFVKPIRKVEISAYADVYRHPWLRFLTDAPSNGVDYLLNVSYKPMRGIEMYVRYRNETKGRNQPDNTTVTDFVSNQTRGSLRYHLQATLSKTVTLKSRVEATWFKHGSQINEQGYMLMQDIIYKPLSSPVSFSTRFALFDTDSYNTRIYAFENDVLFVFSIPPYYNRGSRFYLNLRYTPVKNIDIWLRFAQTYWANQTNIGTGNEQISGNVRSDVRAMLRVKF
ncbi:MAG TPA: helix-hairpin-helix domain-containing protein [Chitinophagales bacterium]|nr:helix-hairpin-helix domain-containing protein [Chitinophagales bacterium]